MSSPCIYIYNKTQDKSDESVEKWLQGYRQVQVVETRVEDLVFAHVILMSCQPKSSHQIILILWIGPNPSLQLWPGFIELNPSLQLWTGSIEPNDVLSLIDPPAQQNELNEKKKQV